MVLVPRPDAVTAAKDGQGVVRELHQALDAPDGADVAVREAGSQQHRAAESFGHEERDAVQRIAEPRAKQHLLAYVDDVSPGVAKLGQVLVVVDKLLPPRWKCVTAYYVGPSLCRSPPERDL